MKSVKQGNSDLKFISDIYLVGDGFKQSPVMKIIVYNTETNHF